MDSTSPQKIVIFDHAGHPFQVELSRGLAARGHEVLHLYSKNLQTPRGNLVVSDGDPDTLAIDAIDIDAEFSRYGMVSRVRQEIQLGEQLVHKLEAFQPSVVVVSNSPLFTARAIRKFCRRNHAQLVYWLQDLLSIGIGRQLRKRFGFIGGFLSAFIKRIESKLLSSSDHVVVISEDFKKYLPRDVIAGARVTTIHNWAPIDELDVLPKENDWSTRNSLDQGFCFLYSGTLGLKHNPELLVSLAEEFRNHDDVRVVVISEGLGAEFLAEEKASRNLDNLVLLPFQDFNEMPQVLAGGDVLLTLLESSAGEFAVPSKVLTYMCAAKPLLLSVPPQNLAARIVEGSGSGLLSAPEDGDAWLANARRLYAEPHRRQQMASNARYYAEQNFHLDSITDRFEQIF